MDKDGNCDNCEFRVVIGLAAMADWMNVSKPTVSMYIKLGMPAAPLGGRWHFHKDRINEWFKKTTYVTWKGQKEPEEMEE